MMQSATGIVERGPDLQDPKFLNTRMPSNSQRQPQAPSASSVLTLTGNSFLKMVAMIALLLSVAFCTLTSLNAQAADEVVTFDNPAHKQMYQALLKAYRCLKCQNQNLWDSNASLAGDLRREIKAQIVSGKSKADIDRYLVARYGEFVLYRPPLSAKTAILWIGPFVLLLIGLTSLVVMVRRKSKSSVTQGSEKRAAAAAQLHSKDSIDKARDLLRD